MDKKGKERKNLLEFIEIFPEFKRGEIRDFEEPDFLMEDNSNIIGIEIVDFIRGQNKQGSADRRNEILRQVISEKAKRQFEEKNKVSLLISFFWNSHYLIQEKEIPKLVESICFTVENHIPSNPHDSSNLSSENLAKANLDGVLHSIKIWRNPDTNKSLWNITSSGWVSTSIDELQRLIDSKNKLVKSYLRNCNEVELLIIADGHFISSMIDIPSEVINHKFSSFFSNVYIFDRIEKKKISLII